MLPGIWLVVCVKRHEHISKEVNDVLLQKALGILVIIGKQLFDRAAYGLLLVIVVFKSHSDVLESHILKYGFRSCIFHYLDIVSES